jgi:A/G-specific adenine glycosylase
VKKTDRVSHSIDSPLISARLLAWFDRHGRKDLPWQHPRSAYRVWLSEIMLQQTQVVTVIGYFLRFVDELPTLQSLAAADLDQVLKLWAGLGYYSRARNLHRAAQICVSEHAGELPRDYDALAALPGIGRSTAGAILAQAYGLRFAILDGNVKRVLSRHRGVRGWSGSLAVQRELWKHAEANTPNEHLADYTQATMDLGATLCTRSRPRCAQCPLNEDCIALRDDLTATLPERKPAKARPTRSTAMLILRDHAGRILLERRPPTGIWARLWSLPEALDESDAFSGHSILRGNSSFVAKKLLEFNHSFSHYHLTVTPLLIEVGRAPSAIADAPDQRWCSRTDAGELGLPAPVRKLLDTLWENR